MNQPMARAAHASWLRRARQILWWSAGLLAVSGAVVTRLGTRWPSVYYMTGSSMEPTMGAQTYFVAWSPANELSRGGLVLFQYQDEDGVFTVLRRLAALPGDTIRMQDGAVIVNGRLQPWPFRILKPDAWRSALSIEPNLYTWGPWVVPPDSLVLLADTRDMMGWPDSRFLGFIPVTAIVASTAAPER